MFYQEWLRIVVPYFMVMGLGQIVVNQSTASSLMLSGVASVVLILVVVAAVILSRRP